MLASSIRGRARRVMAAIYRGIADLLPARLGHAWRGDVSPLERPRGGAHTVAILREMEVLSGNDGVVIACVTARLVAAEASVLHQARDRVTAMRLVHVCDYIHKHA